MQVRAGEHQSAAGLRAIEMRAVLREPQVAAFVVIVQIQRQRKPTVSRGRTQVIAVGVEKPAGIGIVAGDLEAFKTGGPEDKRFSHFRHQPAPDCGCQTLHKFLIHDNVILSLFVLRTDPLLSSAPVRLLHSGLHAALVFPHVEQMTAHFRGEDIGDQQHRRLHGNLSRFDLRERLVEDRSNLLRIG